MPSPARRRSRSLLVATLVLSAAAFFTRLGHRDVATSHEARVAQTARLMADVGWPWSGTEVTVPNVKRAQQGSMVSLLPDPGAPPLRVNPWLVPVLNGRMRLQKPPLPYWCAAVAFRVAGVSEAAARFVPAMLGCLSTLLIVGLARRLLGRSAGDWAGLIWISSYFVVDEHRKAMADPYLAFAVLLAVWAWVRATSDRPAARWAVPLAYAAVGLGALAKGPVVLLHLGVAVPAYCLLYRRHMPGFLAWHVTGLAILVLTALPWPLYVYTHVPYAADLWRYESIGEFGDNAEKARPMWFYLPGVAQVMLPWTPVAIVGAAAAFGRRRVVTSSLASIPGAATGAGTRAALRLPRLFPAVWFAGVVVLFSLANVKKNAYLLPAMPAAVLLATQGVGALLAAARRHHRAGTLVLTLARARAAMLVAGGALSVATVAFVVLKVARDDNLRSPREICARLDQTVLRDVPLCPNDLPEEPSFYLPLRVDERADSPRSVVIVDDRRHTFEPTPAALASRFPGRRVVGAKTIDVSRLPGGQRWRVFEVDTEPEMRPNRGAPTTAPSSS